MISKANAFLVAAAAALGVTMTVGRPAVAETMLDQYTVKDMGIAQVNDAGACVVLVTVNSGVSGADEVRVVGDNSGAARLYAAFGAVDGIIKSAKIDANTDFTLKRKLKAVVIGDPVAELKALHKAFVKEAASSSATHAKQETARTVAVGLGWNVSVGTPQREAYDDMVTVLASVTELNDHANVKKAAYAALLTAAGISPVTYLPI